MRDWDYLSNQPHTDISEGLLKCLKKGNLIEELIFGTASWTKGKQNLLFVLNKVRIDEFTESFKKFNECFFINGDNQEITDYWKRAIIIHPDFNIWILTLDSGNINKKAFDLIYNNYGSDKICLFWI